MSDEEKLVRAHYTRGSLAEAVGEALKASGKTGQLTLDDLAPLDQFHTRGKQATLELGRLAEVQRGQQVLDLGGGLGGAARLLAHDFGCTVRVLDLTEEYCRAGAFLTARTGLTGSVSFHVGSALDAPFPEASFDRVFTQHVSMNIREKERLYREAFRVLRPGGRLALHEIVAGPISPPHFPVPWARQPSGSFLLPQDAFRDLFQRIGLRELAWVDETERARDWFAQRSAAAAGSPSPLSFQLLLGDDFPTMFKNQVRNLDERRVAIVQGVFQREA